MYTPLRRFELGKMLFNWATILLGANFASKFFTEFPRWVTIGVFFAIVILAVMGFFALPESMKEEKDQPAKGARP